MTKEEFFAMDYEGKMWFAKHMREKYIGIMHRHHPQLWPAVYADAKAGKIRWDKIIYQLSLGKVVTG